MDRILLVLAIIAATIAPSAQTVSAEDDGRFAFQFQQTTSVRGVGVEGHVQNPLPWRITNVRVRVDSIDAEGAVIASASGWVLGDVAAGGRGYFYVPVSAPAPTYRASVQAFDKIRLETPTPQAP
jgi:hypothetical protein